MTQANQKHAGMDISLGTSISKTILLYYCTEIRCHEFCLCEVFGRNKLL